MGTYQFKAVSIRQLIASCGGAIALTCSSFAWTCHAQTNNSYPMLMSLKPNAAPIGQTTEHELNARYNLAGASQVLVSGQGVTGEIVPNDQEKPEDRTKNDVMGSKCKLRFIVAADAVPGVRDFRVFTPHGASTLGQLVVVRDSILRESDDNDTKEKAQPVALPATLCGTLEKAEDVDWYKFSVEANSSFTFHVRSQRLLNRLHDMQVRVDPMITLRDANGATLASSDNYYAGDPLLHFNFAQAGEYLLEVRDVRYQGNPDWTYCIEANSRPFITQVDPPVMVRDQAGPFKAIGFQFPVGTAIEMAMPNGNEEIVTISSSIQGIPTNEFPMYVPPNGFALVRENDVPPVATQTGASQTTSNPSTETSFSIPSVVTGNLQTSGEIDRFVFEAKAQEHFSFEVFARRLNSNIDPKIRVTNEQGGLLAEADDATFHRIVDADSWLENWTAPADGKYKLEICDLHQRGGVGFTYAVKASRVQPYFLIEADTDKTLLAPGMGGVIYVKGWRKNGFAGEIQLEVKGLPAGVTATVGRIPSDISDGILYLTAGPYAPRGTANIQITGRGIQTVAGAEPQTLTADAQVLQEYYLPGGGRGLYPVAMHTVSVAEPMDIRRIQLSSQEVRLKPGESQRIDIEIERAPDFKGNVTLDAIYQHLEQPFGNSLPKGVTVDIANSKTLLSGADTKGHITLKAAADAPAIENQLVPINVHVSINFVMKHTFCAAPVSVSVVR